MAHIREREGKYSVVIRKKNVHVGSTFTTKETAELWAWYKETLIDEMEAFDVPKVKLVTLEDACALKIKALIEANSNNKTINAIENIPKDFSEFKDMSLSDITYEMLLKKADDMLCSITTRGGRPENGTGHKRQISPHTVYSKFNALSSVYGYMNEINIPVENQPLKVKAYLRTQIKVNDGTKNVED